MKPGAAVVVSAAVPVREGQQVVVDYGRDACGVSRIDYCPGMGEAMSAEYLASLRQLSGEQKLRTAFALYWEARELKAARLRAEHPDWTEEQVEERTEEIFMHAVT